jgi:nicotinate-nucleotide adenylyltransferase
MDRTGLPIARPGMVIGLLGGSFDPAHKGHAHITREALKRFGLDRVWWLVSPGNPLKEKGPAPLPRRMKAARQVMDHPRVVVTDIEYRLGTRYTAETLKALQALYPGVTFVWLMGADNFATFHHWENWEWIIENVPLGILARPGERISARMSRAANHYAHHRIPGRQALRLSTAPAPRWCFVNVPLDSTSSTEIREKGGWQS